MLYFREYEGVPVGVIAVPATHTQCGGVIVDTSSICSTVVSGSPMATAAIWQLEADVRYWYESQIPLVSIWYSSEL